jgi:putative spermidine/putrescine transport system substrate-binding protein
MKPPIRANWRRSPGHYPALKLGPAWWFFDSPEGMRRYRETTTETAGFYNTVGFNDDTRAYLSIPARHDMARRVDCAYLARLVADHRLERKRRSVWRMNSPTGWRKRPIDCDYLADGCAGGARCTTREENDMNVTRRTFPELPGKIKAQQEAGRVDIDLVLTGTDALSAGLDQGCGSILRQQAATCRISKASSRRPPRCRAGQGQGVVVTYYPSGPLLEYMPAKVKTVPTTAEELLAWTKQNPNRFIYARPANSGPGRTWMMGLPYLLGDKDPKDPVKGWDKTWAYLKELGQNIEYYPTGTGATMKEFGDGSRDMIVSTTGWDINPRVLGIVPKEAKIQTLKGFHWVSDAHYMCVPRASRREARRLLDLISFMLTPQQQAFTYDEGYFYPGPAVKDVPLDMAPESSQKAIAEFGRPNMPT